MTSGTLLPRTSSTPARLETYVKIIAGSRIAVGEEEEERVRGKGEEEEEEGKLVEEEIERVAEERGVMDAAERARAQSSRIPERRRHPCADRAMNTFARSKIPPN